MRAAIVLPGSPWRFLLGFVVAIGLLLPLWLHLGTTYGRVLTWCVEALVGVLQRGAAPLLAVPGEAVGTPILAAIALFAATPMKGMSWRLGWAAGAALLLTAMHISLLALQVLNLAQSATALRAAPRSFLTGEAIPPQAAGNAVVAEAWPWLCPLVTVLLWFLATNQRRRVEAS